MLTIVFSDFKSISVTRSLSPFAFILKDLLKYLSNIFPAVFIACIVVFFRFKISYLLDIFTIMLLFAVLKT